MEKLILWEANLALVPVDPEERMKLWLQMLEMTKADLESGVDKAWGISPAGDRGYTLTDADEADILIGASRFMPFVKFKVIPMLSIDECLAAVKKMQEQAAK